MINDNIILGPDLINSNYNLLYDKKFNVTLETDSLENDGIYVSSYGNVKPEIGIRTFKIINDGTINYPYQTSNIVLGSDENDSYLDINSKGNFNIIKNRSKMLNISSINGLTIGNTNNITSNISDLDIIKSDTTIIDTELLLNSNYYDVVNINQYDYNIYVTLDKSQSNLYKIMLFGKPFISIVMKQFRQL